MTVENGYVVGVPSLFVWIPTPSKRLETQCETTHFCWFLAPTARNLFWTNLLTVYSYDRSPTDLTRSYCMAIPCWWLLSRWLFHPHLFDSTSILVDSHIFVSSTASGRCVFSKVQRCNVQKWNIVGTCWFMYIVKHGEKHHETRWEKHRETQWNMVKNIVKHGETSVSQWLIGEAGGSQQLSLQAWSQKPMNSACSSTGCDSW